MEKNFDQPIKYYQEYIQPIRPEIQTQVQTEYQAPVYNQKNKIVLYQFFLFVNSKSGGQAVKNLLIDGAEKIRFSNKKEEQSLKYDIEVYIYELNDPQNRQKGLINLKKEQDAGKSFVRLIVCGGDGSIAWIIELMIQYQIEMSNCPIGIIPFGTGNDFSRVLGWGGQVQSNFAQNLTQTLKELSTKWINALTEEMDIWEVNIQTHDDGCLKSVKLQQNGKFEKQILQQNNQKLINLQKNMVNYFSIGIDARIGLGFDKNRSKNVYMNRFIYFLEGLKKLFLKTEKINNLVKELRIVEEVDIHKTSKKVLFKTKSNDCNKDDTVLISDTGSLLCLNINSYGGGGSDVWKSCKENSGIQINGVLSTKGLGKQSFGDSKLEFVTFENSLLLGFERLVPGQARRVAQEKGKFELEFKYSAEKQLKTYFQIDGEFFQIIQPKLVTIQQYQNIPNGKIKVLVDISSRK